MKRRKTGRTTTRKQNLPNLGRGNSAVSPEPALENKNIPFEGKTRRGTEITNNNIKISFALDQQKPQASDCDDIENPAGNSLKEGPRDRNFYSFEDDAVSCLDYEPDDTESDFTYPENVKKEAEDDPINIGKECDMVDVGEAYVRSEEIRGEERLSDEDYPLEGYSSSDPDDIDETPERNSKIQTSSDIFRDAHVNFKGNLNITICRSVINNTLNKPVIGNNVANPVQDSTKLIRDLPCEVFCGGSYNRRKRWPRIEYKDEEDDDVHMTKITSRDGIFMSNVANYDFLRDCEEAIFPDDIPGFREDGSPPASYQFSENRSQTSETPQFCERTQNSLEPNSSEKNCSAPSPWMEVDYRNSSNGICDQATPNPFFNGNMTNERSPAAFMGSETIQERPSSSERSPRNDRIPSNNSANSLSRRCTTNMESERKLIFEKPSKNDYRVDMENVRKSSSERECVTNMESERQLTFERPPRNNYRAVLENPWKSSVERECPRSGSPHYPFQSFNNSYQPSESPMDYEESENPQSFKLINSAKNYCAPSREPARLDPFFNGNITTEKIANPDRERNLNSDRSPRDNDMGALNCEEQYRFRNCATNVDVGQASSLQRPSGYDDRLPSTRDRKSSLEREETRSQLSSYQDSEIRYQPSLTPSCYEETENPQQFQYSNTHENYSAPFRSSESDKSRENPYANRNLPRERSPLSFGRSGTNAAQERPESSLDRFYRNDDRMPSYNGERSRSKDFSTDIDGERKFGSGRSSKNDNGNPSSERTSSKSSSLSEGRDNDYVKQWLIRQPSVDVGIRSMLESICEQTKSMCGCDKTHSFVEVRETICQLTTTKLLEAYKVILNRTSWYINLFDLFVDSFKCSSETTDRIMLVDMVSDVFVVFKDTLVDKTTYIQKIIKALQCTGKTFGEAIEMIILRHGTSQISICDILLDIISSEKNVHEYWWLVERLILCRREKVDPQVVIRFLISATDTYPPKIDLVKKIYNDIIMMDLVDREKIPDYLWTPIKLVLKIPKYSHDSSKVGNVPYEAACGSGTFLTKGSVASSLSDRFDKRSLKERTDFEEPTTSESMLEDNHLPVFKRPNVSAPRKRPRGQYEKVETVPYQKSQKVIYNDEILRKINRSISGTPLVCLPRPETPANTIAHPSRLPVISPDFECNRSLHNLYPHFRDFSPELSPDDLRKLRYVLEKVDGEGFLQLLQLYEGPNTIEKFVLSTITLMRRFTGAADAFILLMDALERFDAEVLKKVPVKMTMEVVAMNLIYSLERSGNWEHCRKILMRVKYFHSVVTSKIFLCMSHVMSHMNRYIYVIEILINARDFHWANEIFQCNALNLLGPISSWPFQHCKADVNSRNRVLQLYFEEGFTSNIFSTNDLLNHITVVNKGKIQGCDIWRKINEVLTNLIDCGETNKAVLETLLPHILEKYHPFINSKILHAYLLYLYNFMSNKMAYQLFKICCEAGVYQKYTGRENFIIIRTIMLDFEIKFILNSYFENILKKQVAAHDFYIELKVPNTEQTTGPEILKNISNRDVMSIFTSVVTILQTEYNITIEQPIESRIFVSQNMQRF